MQDDKGKMDCSVASSLHGTPVSKTIHPSPWPFVEFEPGQEASASGGPPVVTNYSSSPPGAEEEATTTTQRRDETLADGHAQRCLLLCRAGERAVRAQRPVSNNHGDAADSDLDCGRVRNLLLGVLCSRCHNGRRPSPQENCRTVRVTRQHIECESRRATGT
jgi:hypothetical protein